jgi:transcriptional regulator with XRE-family HTH domain
MSVILDPYRAKAARVAANLKRETVAVSLGVGYNAVQAYELGLSDPSARVLVGMARLYGVSVESLCRDETPAGAR